MYVFENYFCNYHTLSSCKNLYKICTAYYLACFDVDSKIPSFNYQEKNDKLLNQLRFYFEITFLVQNSNIDLNPGGSELR